MMQIAEKEREREEERGGGGGEILMIPFSLKTTKTTQKLFTAVTHYPLESLLLK